ncbi:MAG: helix-turn-helix transcriptional regulator [Woeseiaceae bacterium]|nr:helix-turn-helix transcriptional regulator [Woeseiaceae bacterium]
MQPSGRPAFGELLRQWREARRYSQLDLALEANVSSKHVSFLETGRNRPSREMILRLSNAMDVPLRDRNLLFEAAGFASAYRESALDAPEVAQVEEAIARILDKHEPFPAIVVDANWDVVKQNLGGMRLAALFLDEPELASQNAFELLFSPDGLQPYVENWERLSSILLMRLFRESLSATSGNRKRDLFARIESMPTTPENWREIATRLPGGPTIDLKLRKDDLRLDFFTTVTTIGTPQDITLQEIRIESYFPADDATRTLCERWLTA